MRFTGARSGFDECTPELADCGRFLNRLLRL